MQSKSVEVDKKIFHQSFVNSKRFEPEVKAVPFRWRKRLIAQCLDKMSWSSHWKIYESIAVEHVREFVEKHVPHGVDLAASDDDLCKLAEQAAGHVVTALWSATSSTHALQIIECECNEYGIDAPQFDALRDVIARVTDSRWWRRKLRKVHGRAHEMGAINLGYVHYKAEPYASNEAVLRRIAQNRRNALALEAVTLQNENGDKFKLSELANKTTANKAIRRGELMLRINGFETMARENNDQGLFLTWTCPSAYHSRLKPSGNVNPKYSGATPKKANDYLCKVTSLARSALARRGIALYGFRIAEPHHDGCPHWHLLLFVRATAGYKTPWVKDIAARAIRVMRRYAWRSDRGEAGAFKYRFDAKRIDWSKGSAAGYIAKYVAKNIDGAHVGEHKTIDGKVVVVEWESGEELTPSARVEAWASTWGIRQFQQWGGAPVTVWRELRRIKKEMIEGAATPSSMRMAWDAVQKIEGEKRADWAQYLRAQGGAVVGRKDLIITLAKNPEKVTGRYGEMVREIPYGVRCAHLMGVVYYSTRYTWTLVGKGACAIKPAFKFTERGEGIDTPSGGVASPRTRVNNCTQSVTENNKSFAVDVNKMKLKDVDKKEMIEVATEAGFCFYPRIVLSDATGEEVKK